MERPLAAQAHVVVLFLFQQFLEQADHLVFRLLLRQQIDGLDAHARVLVLQQQAGRAQTDDKLRQALFPVRFEGVAQSDSAAWTALARVLLNLDEFITRE